MKEAYYSRNCNNYLLTVFSFGIPFYIFAIQFFKVMGEYG